MSWPKDLYDVFFVALDIAPIEGKTKHDVLETMFDEVARRTVWRAKGDPTQANAALRSPYTPLGSIVNESIVGQARSLTLRGADWGKAVDALHRFIEENAEHVFAAFADQPSEYEDGL